MAFDPGFAGCILLSLISTIIFAIVFFLRRGNKFKYLFGALFSVYLIFAFSITICPIYFYSTMRESFIESGWKIRDCIYLVPFTDGVTWDDLLNVVLTFPLGFMLPLIKKRFTWRHAVAAGLLFGITVELTQLLTAILQGFTFKYVDTSDLICNFAGTMLGWAVIAGFILIVQRKYSEYSYRNSNSLISYLLERRVK